ncbi:recombinase family protein [Nitrospira sp. Nam74]
MLYYFAAYFRFSDAENQKETSIEDQDRECEGWVRRHSGCIVARYADRGIPGRDADNRPELQRLLQECEKKDRSFNALIVHSLSRLARSIIDTMEICDLLNFYKIRLVSINDAIDTLIQKPEMTKIQVIFKAMQHEGHNDELGSNVARTLRGVFLRGYSTGQKPYGYTSEPIEDPLGAKDSRGYPKPLGYRVTIKPEHALVVRRVFELYAKGKWPREIVTSVRSEFPYCKITSAGIRLMLRNETYIGRVIFNRFHFLRHPTRKKKVKLERPKDEWLVRNDDSLRIIDEDTWQKVQTRLAHESRNGRHTGPGTPHLLSGFLKCAECRGSFVIVAEGYVGCNANKYNGEKVCTNGLWMKQESLEEIIAQQLAEQLRILLPLFVDRLRHTITLAGQKLATVNKRLKELDHQVEKYHKVVREALSGPAHKHALDAYNAKCQELAALQEEAAKSKTLPRVKDITYDKAVAEAFLDNLATALLEDVASGRQLLGAIVKEIVITAGAKMTHRCPICHQILHKMTPKHFDKHNLSLPVIWKRFSYLGFSHEAKLKVQLNPASLAKFPKTLELNVLGSLASQFEDLMSFSFHVSPETSSDLPDQPFDLAA